MNVEKIIEKAGGVKEVANELGMTTQAVYTWQRNGYIPIRKIRRVAEMAGIPVNQLAKLIP